MLHFRHFHKSYGRHTVLSIESKTISPGIYWVKGTNGSGKSTLLKSIAGFLFFEGEIHLNNISLKKNSVTYRKIVNFADAEPVFPDFMTGREMIDLFVKAKGGPRGQETYFIESMRMAPYLNEPLGTYSSGMLKKLSLLLAFLGNPALILLDEPLITIDTESLSVLYDWIRLMEREQKTTFLLSSHQALDPYALAGAKELFVKDQTLS